MAFERGVAQDVSIDCYDGETLTDPENPVVTVSTDDGEFGAADNSPTPVSTGKIHIALSAAEMTGDLVTVRVASDNLEVQSATFYTEEDYTKTRAEQIDDLALEATVAALNDLSEAEVQALLAALNDPSAAAIVAAIAAAHGSGRYDHAGTIAVISTIKRLIVDGDDELLFIRGDTHSLTYRFWDDDTGAWESLSGTATLTIREVDDREETSPGDPVAEIEGTIYTDAVNGDRVEFSVTDSDLSDMDLDLTMDFDVATVDGATVTTYVRGKATRTWDVGRD